MIEFNPPIAFAGHHKAKVLSYKAYSEPFVVVDRPYVGPTTLTRPAVYWKFEIVGGPRDGAEVTYYHSMKDWTDFTTAKTNITSVVGEIEGGTIEEKIKALEKIPGSSVDLLIGIDEIVVSGNGESYESKV